MTTPAATGPLYATVDDLRDSLSSTDSGIGTPAQLSDDQLTLALHSASNRVSVYAGEAFDPTGVNADPPPVILHDLTLDLAAFWAWKNYLKGKIIPADHPAFIAYQNATTMLNDVRDGKIALGVGWAGGEPGPGQESALVINRIPPIFTGKDSNTRVGLDGVLEDDVPIGQWTPRGGDWLGAGGPVYQG
jgi:phage gp36-like protein